MQKLVRTPFHSDDSTDDNDEQCGTISSDDGKVCFIPPNGCSIALLSAVNFLKNSLKF